MQTIKQLSIEHLMLIGVGVATVVMLLTDTLWHAVPLPLVLAMLLCFLACLPLLTMRRQRLRNAMSVEAPAAPLLKAGALQDAIYNSANFSTIATDADGIIQIFNVGAQRMLGYAPGDVVNKLTPASISDAGELIERASVLSAELGTIIHPGFDALIYKAMRGIEDIYELTYIRADGSRLPALVSVTALRGADDKVIGFLLIGTDNTVRKQVEAEQALLDQRLRDQHFYTRSLIESNIDSLITTDSHGVISDVNHQMETLTGRSRHELIGATFESCFTEPQRAAQAVAHVLQEGKVSNYELTALARDGKQTVVSLNASTFHDRHHTLQGVFAAARDVTERKQFEHALQETNVALHAAREAADKANRAKSEFLSSMSHELRTPLNAILGFAQLMATEVPPPSPGQQRSIDQILKGGWYLLRLINEILDLSMIEAGKVTMSQESMSVNEVLLDCKGMIEPQASARGIAMRFPQFDETFYVHADRTRIKQVMINLLSNAIKYNRTGGEVIVGCSHSADAGGAGRVRISVQDTGAGLSAEQLAQLFQPFNRLGQHDGAEEGTGIGLVVTKQLVDLMGGRIGVDSTVGTGTTFWVEFAASLPPTLALDNIDESTLARRLPPQAAGAEPTLLYVEDNPANLALVEQLIARRGDLKLLTAINADIGIELAHRYLPDVILMDINLPGISGYEALRRLLADPASSHIPVLALSANAIPRDIEKGLKAGFFHYLTKPIRVHEFMSALDVALRHAANHRTSLLAHGAGPHHPADILSEEPHA